MCNACRLSKSLENAEYLECPQNSRLTARVLYLSWDAASWHISKELLEFVDEHNKTCSETQPKLELAPLPASAQFLNIIESVFSGMARAIIHNSDYSSVKAATEAIDRYFSERNQHFKDNPSRAGKKIWGLERTSTEFNAGNNCRRPKLSIILAKNTLSK